MGTETKVKHTPGPWTFEGSADDWKVTNRKPDAPVINDSRFVCYVNTEEDARLIAAAPDLLAALELFIEAEIATEASGDCGRWDVESTPMMQAARAAIAKARD